MSNENTMQELLDQYDVRTIKKGDILDGTIISVDEKGANVNINYAFDGFISKDEVSNKSVNITEELKMGDSVRVIVLSPNDGEGTVVLSRRRLLEREERDAIRALLKEEGKELKEAFDNETTVNVNVKEEIKGGLLCYYGKTRVFMPGSLISRNKTNGKDLVGDDLEVRIIELDLKNNKVVASRRVLEEEAFKAEEEKNWNSLKEGEKVTGTVRNTTKFGAFVEVLPGVQGLVHINDLAWERVRNVEDVVKKGDTVEVFIGKVDKEAKRLSLILKDNLQEPWTLNAGSLKVGEVLEGKVKKLAKFGAFVELFKGVEGLVHLSELTPEPIKDPAEVVKVGDVVKVKVLNVDLGEKKLSLSIKDASGKTREYVNYVDETEEDVTLGDLFADLKNKL
ncbi:MAG: S1 RNA-binding domain-containing protein [Clostridium sp.]|uniref:S1 RNA-binding domain-containing protein n=1 Tax=Clostridium sp. TaxID=1506 RepID=UPI003F2FCA42